MSAFGRGALRAMAIGCALIASALVRPAAAQILAQVTPVKYSLTVRPGEPSSRDVQVSNLGDQPVIVRVRMSDWQLSERGELGFAPLGSTPTTLAGLVQFEPAEFSLAAGENGLIRVTVRMPADGPPTRWGVMLSEVRPAVVRPSGLGPRAIAELGTTLYVSRIPAGPARAEVTGLVVAPLGRDSMSVSVRVQNGGERHFYVMGEFAVSDSSGQRVRSGTTGTGVVLPGGARVFTWICDAPGNPGRYTAAATLDTGDPELMVGETSFTWPMPRPAPAPVAQQLPH